MGNVVIGVDVIINKKSNKMNNIEKFFKDNLDNKMAYVSSDGLFLEGNLEQKCKLEFIQYFGLACSVQLEYNRLNIVKEVEQILIQNREGFDISYDTRDKIINALIPKMKDMFIHCGKISNYGIEKISSVYDKENIRDVDIKYSNGSTVRISCIQDIS